LRRRHLGAHEIENVSETYYPARSLFLSSELLWITFQETTRTETSPRDVGGGGAFKGGNVKIKTGLETSFYFAIGGS